MVYILVNTASLVAPWPGFVATGLWPSGQGLLSSPWSPMELPQYNRPGRRASPLLASSEHLLWALFTALECFALCFFYNEERSEAIKRSVVLLQKVICFLILQGPCFLDGSTQLHFSLIFVVVLYVVPQLLRGKFCKSSTGFCINTLLH